MEKKFKPFSSRGLSWPTSVIKYLGINTPLNKFDELSLFEENFASTIHNVQSTLNLWLVRGLTLLEKITVLKTLVTIIAANILNRNQICWNTLMN